MFTSIHIQNFRGIRSGTLSQLAPLTVLIGPNGCGKSTVLESIEIAATGDPHNTFKAINSRRGTDEIRWMHHRDQNEIQWQLTFSDGKELRRMYRHRSWSPDPVKGHDATYLGPGVSSSRDITALYTQAVERGRREQAQELVRALLPKAQGLEILTNAQHQAILHVVYPWGSIPLSVVGDGVGRVIQMACELVTSRLTTLVEEPEIHLHPRAIRLVGELFMEVARRDRQVVASTHSLELVDAILAAARDERDLDRVAFYRLGLDDGVLKSTRYSGEEARFSRQQIEDDLR